MRGGGEKRLPACRRKGCRPKIRKQEMRSLLLASVLGILCSCSPPELSTDGNIKCAVYGQGENGGSVEHEFDYPSDEKSRQVLREWLDHYNSQSCSLMMGAPAVPSVIVRFPNKTSISFYAKNSYIYISPFSVFQYSRQADARDRELMNYIMQLPKD